MPGDLRVEVQETGQALFWWIFLFCQCWSCLGFRAGCRAGCVSVGGSRDQLQNFKSLPLEQEVQVTPELNPILDNNGFSCWRSSSQFMSGWVRFKQGKDQEWRLEQGWASLGMEIVPGALQRGERNLWAESCSLEKFLKSFFQF